MDPRALTAAALKAARHRGVDISSGTTVTQVLLANGRATGVGTGKTSYCRSRRRELCGGVGRATAAAPVSDSPGQGTDAVAGRSISRFAAPRHSRSRNLPGPAQRRPHSGGSDSRRSGIRQAHRRGHDSAHAPGGDPSGSRSRPGPHAGSVGRTAAGSPDNLPILGATRTPGYFVATGHFRDGILLTPVTAHVMAQMITGAEPEYDVSAFSPARFESS